MTLILPWTESLHQTRHATPEGAGWKAHGREMGGTAKRTASSACEAGSRFDFENPECR